MPGVLSIEARRLTAAERAELAAERARRVAAHARAAEELRRTSVAAARSMLWIVGFFALIAAFNVHAGHLDTAAIAGAGAALFLGIAAWIRSGPALPPVLDVPAVVRVDQALARDEVRVIDVRADAAVVVRAVFGDEGPQIVGDLLRTAAGQVVYLSRAPCRDVDAERLPNTHLRITCTPGVGILRVEPLGERVEPLIVVDDTSDDQFWCGEIEAIVWTPGEDRCESLDLRDAELRPTAFPLGIDELAAALVTRS